MATPGTKLARRRRRPQRSDGEDTRLRLLEVAGRLFAEKGLARTLSKEICHGAGANMAAVNYHFGGREGLYEAVLIEAHRQLVSFDELDSIGRTGGSPEEKVVAILRLLIANTAHPKSSWGVRVIIRELMSPTPHAPAFVRNAIAPKARIVMRIIGEALGLAPSHPTVQRSAALVVTPALMMALMPWQARKEVFPALDAEPEAIARDWGRYALGGLAAVRKAARRVKAKRRTAAR